MGENKWEEINGWKKVGRNKCEINGRSVRDVSYNLSKSCLADVNIVSRTHDKLYLFISSFVISLYCSAFTGVLKDSYI